MEPAKWHSPSLTVRSFSGPLFVSSQHKSLSSHLSFPISPALMKWSKRNMCIISSQRNMYSCEACLIHYTCTPFTGGNLILLVPSHPVKLLHKTSSVCLEISHSHTVAVLVLSVFKHHFCLVSFFFFFFFFFCTWVFFFMFFV